MDYVRPIDFAGLAAQAPARAIQYVLDHENVGGADDQISIPV